MGAERRCHPGLRWVQPYLIPGLDGFSPVLTRRSHLDKAVFAAGRSRRLRGRSRPGRSGARGPEHNGSRLIDSHLGALCRNFPCWEGFLAGGAIPSQKLRPRRALGPLKCGEQSFLFLGFKESLDRNSSAFPGFTECQISQRSRLAQLSRKQLGTISVLTESS